MTDMCAKTGVPPSGSNEMTSCRMRMHGDDLQAMTIRRDAECGPWCRNHAIVWVSIDSGKVQSVVTLVLAVLRGSVELDLERANRGNPISCTAD